MLLVTNLTNKKRSKAILKMTETLPYGFETYNGVLRACALDESSLSSRRVNPYAAGG